MTGRSTTPLCAVVHNSEHWTNGGTGLTNFSGYQFPIYLEAARHLEVVLSPLTDDTFMDEGDEAWPLHAKRKK